jgi:hypothetical protein
LPTAPRFLRHPQRSDRSHRARAATLKITPGKPPPITVSGNTKESPHQPTCRAQCTRRFGVLACRYCASRFFACRSIATPIASSSPRMSSPAPRSSSIGMALAPAPQSIGAAAAWVIVLAVESHGLDMQGTHPVFCRGQGIVLARRCRARRRATSSVVFQPVIKDAEAWALIVPYLAVDALMPRQHRQGINGKPIVVGVTPNASDTRCSSMPFGRQFRCV